MEVEIIEGIDPLSAVVQLDPIRFPLNASETIPPFQKPPSLNPSAAEQPRAEIKPEFRDDVSYSGSSEGTSSDVDSAAKRDTRKRVVVVGLGMVAMAFMYVVPNHPFLVYEFYPPTDAVNWCEQRETLKVG